MAGTAMPTAARLVAAVALGCGSALMAVLLVRFYPEEPWENDLPSMLKVFFVIGGLIGWFSLGKRAATEEGKGVFLGLRAGITVAVAILFVLSINEVVREILNSKLAGARPMEAIWAMFFQVAEYAVFMLHGKFLAIAAFVSVTIGVLVKNTQRTWR